MVVGYTPIPSSIFAGETIAWEESLDNYRPGDGWAADLILSSDGAADSLIINGVAEGEAFRWDYSATGTATLDLGGYRWAIKVAKDDERQIAATGRLQIYADPLEAPAELTQLQTDLAGCEAAIRAAVTDQEGVARFSFSSTIGNRDVEFRSLAEMRAHRAWLAREIDRVKGRLGYGRKGGWQNIQVKLS